MREAVIGAVGRAADEDERSAEFRRRTEEYLDRSYGLAPLRAILGDSSEAEDAVQDACVAAWRGWGSLRDIELFERWFQRIVINTCRDRIRQRSRRGVVDISADLVLEAGDAYASVHIKDALDTAIARLHPADQTPLALRYYRDLRVEDDTNSPRTDSTSRTAGSWGTTSPRGRTPRW